jgi:hypothetical protein
VKPVTIALADHAKALIELQRSAELWDLQFDLPSICLLAGQNGCAVIAGTAVL